MAVAPAVKEAKKAPKHWFESGEAHANTQEVLFYSFLLIASGKSVPELEEWVKKVLVLRSGAEEAQERWRPLTQPLSLAGRQDVEAGASRLVTLQDVRDAGRH